MWLTLNPGHQLLPCLAVDEFHRVRDLGVVRGEVEHEEGLHGAEVVFLLDEGRALVLLGVLDELEDLDL